MSEFVVLDPRLVVAAVAVVDARVTVADADDVVESVSRLVVDSRADVVAPVAVCDELSVIPAAVDVPDG